MSPAQHSAFGLPEDALDRILAIIATQPEVESVRLYGSRAMDTHRPGSDIDLCLTAPRLDLWQLMKLAGRIDDLLLPWKVDLSLWHLIDNPDLRAHIERVGVQLAALRPDDSADHLEMRTAHTNRSR